MAEVFMREFKRGDAFSITYDLGTADMADWLEAQVRAYVETTDEPLATLEIVEAEASSTIPAGRYYLSTDASTADWPEWVKVDVFNAATGLHDETTMTFHFVDGVTRPVEGGAGT